MVVVDVDQAEMSRRSFAQVDTLKCRTFATWSWTESNHCYSLLPELFHMKTPISHSRYLVSFHPFFLSYKHQTHSWPLKSQESNIYRAQDEYSVHIRESPDRHP
jgi:hypothetical protein